ncbi:MAG: insulinase family protein [Gemmatimonadales bacterium]|nr:insulinase family protein [Gemmatimonadales bacterium]MYG50708.1 insulinase family protein [Gemmatimonadales bacterium]MYK02686.1 insulinase family protein [Candidatus Palauibacter ramosifaciens]
MTGRLDREVYRTCLPDGPIVLSEHMDSVRSVAIGLWVRQGRVHEDAGHGGVSHLLEHMVFKGTHRRSARDLAWELERLGGALDAYTTHEFTAFQARVPAGALGVALDVLCDLAFFPRLSGQDLDVEREVVLEEIAAAAEVPEDIAFEEHARALYGGHPYGEPILGTRESVRTLTVSALAEVHDRAYRPGNVVVTAAGAVEHEDLVEGLARWLPRRAAAPAPADPPAPVAESGFRRMRREGGRQTHIVLGGLSVPYRDPLRYALHVAATALGGGMSSRLFQRIRETRGLAYAVYSFHGFHAQAGHVGAYVGTRPETAEEARKAVEGELALLAREGLTREELDDTRSQLKGQFLISLESPASRMNRLAGVALYGHAYRTLDEVAARIDAVDRAQCLEAAAYFAPERLATLELAPGNAPERTVRNAT